MTKQWLFPSRCVFCDALLEEYESESCNMCYNKIKSLHQGTCHVCGKPVDQTQEICLDCQKTPRTFDLGKAMFVYEGLVKRSLLGLKFSGQTWKGSKYGRMLADFFVTELGRPWEFDMIIPVPIHWTRRFIRGYNQAEILGQAFWKRYLELEGSQVAYEENLLCRKQLTKAQKFLTPEERRANLNYSMKLHPSKKDLVRNKRILLIDDIFTTGATIDACAIALKASGAKSVCFLSVSIGHGR